jgi:rRNA maturation endonuclease Nob1
LWNWRLTAHIGADYLMSEEKYKCLGCGALVEMDALCCKHCGAMLAIKYCSQYRLKKAGW